MDSPVYLDREDLTDSAVYLERVVHLDVQVLTE